MKLGHDNSCEEHQYGIWDLCKNAKSLPSHKIRKRSRSLPVLVMHQNFLSRNLILILRKIIPKYMHSGGEACHYCWMPGQPSIGAFVWEERPAGTKWRLADDRSLPPSRQAAYIWPCCRCCSCSGLSADLISARRSAASASTMTSAAAASPKSTIPPWPSPCTVHTTTNWRWSLLTSGGHGGMTC